MIALDKCPGVRPIGIGETVRCITAKAVLSVIKEDIRQATGSLQLCAGHLSGCEAAVHSVQKTFASVDCETAVLVDATNAFNSLNRQTTLRNIQHLCPSFSTILINTYREDVNLYVGGSTLLSEEGTTQGDPLAMLMYALGTIPLINHLSSIGTQVWHADDPTVCGRLSEARLWWDHLIHIGPDFGYFPNPSKTCVIVKEQFYNDAITTFQGSGVSVTAEGKRHLGAALGSSSFVDSYVEAKISTWAQELQLLADISITHPHAAYAGFVHGFIGKWNFLMRCIPNTEDFLVPLEAIIRTKFLPNLTGQPSFNDDERRLFALLPRLGGLGIVNPQEHSSYQFSASTEITSPLVRLIL